MVHNSRARTQNLIAFIMANVCGHRTSFTVSDVKQDGTVFVRFRSSPVDSATQLAGTFSKALVASKRPFLWADDNKIRLPLDTF